MNLELNEFGSCQYSSIKGYMEEFKNNLPLWTKTDLYNIKIIHENKGSIGKDGSIKLSFSSNVLNKGIIDEIINNIKKEFLTMLEDDKEFYKLEDCLNNINNIKSIDDCYNYCKSCSCDLWSTNNFIMNHFYKRDVEDFSNNDMIAISILWLLENNIVTDIECFYNFDT